MSVLSTDLVYYLRGVESEHALEIEIGIATYSTGPSDEGDQRMSAGFITDLLDNACTHLHACLLPGGQISTTSPGVPEEVRWLELGSIRQAGVPMSFVRVVIGESTWATLV